MVIIYVYVHVWCIVGSEYYGLICFYVSLRIGIVESVFNFLSHLCRLIGIGIAESVLIS